MLKIYLKIKVYFFVNNLYCDIIVESSCIFNKKRNPLNVNVLKRNVEGTDCVGKFTRAFF